MEDEDLDWRGEVLFTDWDFDTWPSQRVFFLHYPCKNALQRHLRENTPVSLWSVFTLVNNLIWYTLGETRSFNLFYDGPFCSLNNFDMGISQNLSIFFYFWLTRCLISKNPSLGSQYFLTSSSFKLRLCQQSIQVFHRLEMGCTGCNLQHRRLIYFTYVFPLWHFRDISCIYLCERKRADIKCDEGDWCQWALCFIS